VDVGVHQDGLVHVSAMSKSFVKDPRAVVKPGDIVRVKVLEIDKLRKRIALSLRLDEDAAAKSAPAAQGASRQPKSAQRQERADDTGGAFADAFRRAQLK
jgi:uncharacterized protein